MNQSIAAALTLLLCPTGCSTLRQVQALNNYKITLASYEQRDTTVTEVTSSTNAEGDAAILSAFFGIDDDLPRNANKAICNDAHGKDGMPVIFSREIDFDSMQAGDFKVTTAAGQVGVVHCVTLAPADDKGELRTALLVGQFGSMEDQPAKVEIVGNLLSMDKSLNFKGASANAIALEVGPTIILAEHLSIDQLDLKKQATELPFGGGTGCPAGTTQAVNAVWVGGVSKRGGGDAEDDERQQYRVTIQRDDGSTTDVTPFALADLQDGDNNHLLCLDVPGLPISVSLPANFLQDPRGDLNPNTQRAVTRARRSGPGSPPPSP